MLFGCTETVAVLTPHALAGGMAHSD